MVGTILYAAPEQFDRSKYTDSRTDIFGLGKLLYTMLTGSVPEGGDLLLGEEHDAYRGLAIEKILYKSTSMNPEDRYQSCEDMRKALSKVTISFSLIEERHILAQNQFDVIEQMPADDESAASDNQAKNDRPEEFDVFISFKHTDKGEETQDCRMAEELFQFLTGKGIRTFFSKESLITMGVGNYLAMIEKAIEQSKVLILVGTTKEHLSANWVFLEYSMYVSTHEDSRMDSVFLYISREMLPQMDLPGAFRLYSAYQKIEDIVKIVENKLKSENVKTVKKTDPEIRKDANNLRKVMSTGYILEGRYLLQELVKDNEYYDQYVAQDLRMGNKCIVKIFFTGLVPKDKINELRSLVKNEKDILIKIRHVGVPNLLDYVESDLYYALIMDYFDSVSLIQMKQLLGKIPEKMVLGWMRDLCLLLQNLHSSSPEVFHCNIKPSNILLGKGQEIELINFSAAVTSGSQHPWFSIYSRGFEDVFSIGREKSAQTDIFAVGLTLLVLLGDGNMNLKANAKNFSQGAEYIINKCICQPDKRYKSCAEIVRDIDFISFLNFREGIKKIFLNVWRHILFRHQKQYKPDGDFFNDIFPEDSELNTSTIMIPNPNGNISPAESKLESSEFPEGFFSY